MRQLSSHDAAFLYAETPTWHMHVAALGIADPAQAPVPLRRDVLDHVRELVVQRLPEAPQFRWQLVETPLGIDRPHWVESAELDPDWHIRRVTLPSPGSEEQLDALVGELVSTKLDRSRPLWEIYLIDGLADGRVAMLTKMHHSLIDGVSGAGLMEVLLDLTPEPRPPSGAVHEPVGNAAPPGLTRFVRGAASRVVSAPSKALKFTAQTTRQGIDAVGRLLPANAAKAPPTLPFQAPRTVLNGEFTARRQLSRSRVELERLRHVRAAFDVKVNDVVLAMVAGGLRRYLLERGELPRQPLIVQCPVSLRDDDSRRDVGSKVGSLFVNLATHVDDPIQRLRWITASTGTAKEVHQVVARHQRVGVTELFVPGLIGLAARLYTAMHLDRTVPPVNLVVSNVPGPPFPLYVAGAPLVGMYPMGPLLLGMGLNVTAFSHHGNVDIGVFTCPDLVPEPHRIAEHLTGALEELESAASSSS